MKKKEDKLTVSKNSFLNEVVDERGAVVVDKVFFAYSSKNSKATWNCGTRITYFIPHKNSFQVIFTIIHFNFIYLFIYIKYN